jgi:hypothetical protein
MTALRRRCACPTCVAKSSMRATRHLRHDRPDIAHQILEATISDMAIPPNAECAVKGMPISEQRAMWWHLELELYHAKQALIEYQGWAHAYQDQVRARIALGDKCPCVAGARR